MTMLRNRSSDIVQYLTILKQKIFGQAVLADLSDCSWCFLVARFHDLAFLYTLTHSEEMLFTPEELPSHLLSRNSDLQWAKAAPSAQEVPEETHDQKTASKAQKLDQILWVGWTQFCFVTRPLAEELCGTEQCLSGRLRTKRMYRLASNGQQPQDAMFCASVCPAT